MFSERRRDGRLSRNYSGTLFRRSVVPVFISILVFILLKAAAPPGFPLIVSLDLRGPPGLYQLYFDRGSGFNPADSSLTSFPGGEGQVEFQIPTGPISGIRIDPGDKISTVSVSKLCIQRSAPQAGSLCWSGAELVRQFRPRRDIADFKSSGGELIIRNYGRQPYFESNPEISVRLTEFSARQFPGPAVLAVLAGLSAFFLLPAAGRKFEVISAAQRRVFAALAIAACGIFLLNAGWTIGRIVPPFQGPDENDHIGKLAAIEQGSGCGWTRFEFAYLLSVLTPIIHHPENKVSAELISLIFKAEQSGSAAPDQAIGVGACAYSRLYLQPVFLLNSAIGRSIDTLSAVGYIQAARRSLTLASAAFWTLTALVIVFGRPLINPSVEFTAAIRSGAALGALYLCLLPQTIFFNSVVNQDYLLLAAGSFIAISLFFRIRILSDLLLLLSLAAGYSKVFYLFPFAGAVVIHYALVFLPQDPGFVEKIKSFICRRRVSLAALFIAAPFFGFLSLRLLRDWYCRDHWCYWLEQASFFSDPFRFSAELGVLWRKFHTLGLPADFNFDSAFAAFGWLDTYLHTGFAAVYTGPITAALTAGAVFLPLALWRGTVSERRSVIFVFVVALCFLAVSFFTLFLIAVLMQGWCGAGSEFGCGYQKRYELPLYGLFPVLFFSSAIFSLARAGSGGGTERSLQLQLTGVLAAAQLAAAVICYYGQVEALSARYFSQEGDLRLYQQNLDRIQIAGGN